MSHFRNIALLIFMSSFLLAGCYGKTIRHLASDVGLISTGTSSRGDVLTYLGEPDQQLIRDEAVEEWVYVEEKITTMQRMPLIGWLFSSSGYERVTVVLNGDIVQSCQYREYNDDEFDWADDYSWQENNQ